MTRLSFAPIGRRLRVEVRSGEVRLRGGGGRAGPIIPRPRGVRCTVGMGKAPTKTTCRRSQHQDGCVITDLAVWQFED